MTKGMDFNKMTKKDMMAWAITVILALACLIVPEQGIYTHEVKLFLAITVFCLSLAAFEVVPNMIVAMLLSGLYIASGCAPASVAMSPWVSTTSLLVIGALFMAATLQASGLLSRIAYRMMCWAKGNYFVLMIYILITSVVLNIMTSGYAYMIMGPLCLGLCISMDGVKKKLGAGIAAAVMIGGCTSHAYTYQVAAWAVILPMAEGYHLPGDVTPLSIILHCWPLFLVSVFLLFIISKWYKPDKPLGDITYFKEQLSKLGKITAKERNNAIMIVILLVYIFTVNIHGFSINMGFALIPWMVYLPFMKGADFDTLKMFSWEMVFFVMSCMSIGAVAMNVGIDKALANLFILLLGGNTSVVAIMGLVFGIVFGLNFLMTPMAIFALVTKPILELATGMGFSPLPFMYAINACSEAIILPYEYVPYLIVYSFGMISMKDFFKINVLRSVVILGSFLFILVPYWTLIGLL